MGTRGRNPLELVLTQPGVVSGANAGGSVHVHGARDRSWNFTLDGIEFERVERRRLQLLSAPHQSGRLVGVQGPDRQPDRGIRAQQRWPGCDDHPFRQQPACRHACSISIADRNTTPTSGRTTSTGWPSASLPRRCRASASAARSAETGPSFRQYAVAPRGADTRSHADGLQRSGASGDLPVFDRPDATSGGVSGASVDANGNPWCPRHLQRRRAGSAGTRTRPDHSADRRRHAAAQQLRGRWRDGLNTAGFTFSAAEEEKQMDFVTKVDHTFSDRHSAFVRYSQRLPEYVLRSGERRSARPFPGPPASSTRRGDPYNWAGNYRWSGGGNIVNELVVGQNHFTFDFVSPMADPVPILADRCAGDAARKTTRWETFAASTRLQFRG